MSDRKFMKMDKCERLLCDGFDISYVPQLEQHELNPMDLYLVAQGKIKRENIGRPETAIVVEDRLAMMGKRFFILYGDYREQYKRASERGLDACIEIFMENIDNITDTSEMPNQVTQ